MRSRQSTFLGLALVLSAAVLGGCGPVTAESAAAPATALPMAESAATPAAALPVVTTEAPDPLVARDAALAYIVAHYGERAPAPDLTWTAESATPEGPVGSGSCRYTAGDWVVTVSYPLVAPEAIVYQVAVTSRTTGFQWEGEVDAVGQVTERSAFTGGLPVAGWLGCVSSTPAGAQFDDYVSLQPAGAGDVGVAGANAEVEAAIEALRDKEEPGKYAHFWGTLTCDVPDYGGCQLVVTRLRAGPTVADPDPVEGWEGILVSNPPMAQFDDYFILAGDFPVGYGIASSGPALAAQLESLRDTGTAVRIWGHVRCGVPDAYGSQIVVTRFEIIGTPPAPTPTLAESGAEPVDGWVGTFVPMPSLEYNYGQVVAQSMESGGVQHEDRALYGDPA